MKKVLVVGAGLSGATCAIELANAGFEVTVVEERPHIAGNAFDRHDAHGVMIHQYGPHIFHTNSARVFDFLSRYTSWRSYEHRVLARVGGIDYPMPLNFTSIGRYFNRPIETPEDLDRELSIRRVKRDRIHSSEDFLLNSVGPELMDAFFSGYTRKQWGRSLRELDAAVAARVPVRNSFDDRYFQDRYQGIPLGGYTEMIHRMLDHRQIRLELNYPASAEDFKKFDIVIYTGAIDRLLDYKYGQLPYRSLRFEFEYYAEVDKLLPVGTVNYPDMTDGPHTRLTEFKHLTGQMIKGTTIVREIPTDVGDPYYPIPTDANRVMHDQYVAELTTAWPNVRLAGRLAEYRYYNMDQAVASALTAARRIIEDE